MAEGVQGYLVVTVVEASGKSRDDTYVWDDATKEGYVKGKGEAHRRGANAISSGLCVLRAWAQRVRKVPMHPLGALLARARTRMDAVCASQAQRTALEQTPSSRARPRQLGLFAVQQRQNRVARPQERRVQQLGGLGSCSFC